MIFYKILAVSFFTLLSGTALHTVGHFADSASGISRRMLFGGASEQRSEGLRPAGSAGK